MCCLLAGLRALCLNIFMSMVRPLAVAMCASTVSLKMLSEIARVEGFLFEETLTGFKWIGSHAENLIENRVTSCSFVTRSSLAFCGGDHIVYDEDGRFVQFMVLSVSCIFCFRIHAFVT